ncbi:hypothetical protein GCM10009827_030010 [Dactylosporangium maewongense]|uniref:Uncharacterized protein n=1 Tax=Dactylosporangium maewongense TaxID=634393 RepID=A0ABN2A972_9ACTN
MTGQLPDEVLHDGEWHAVTAVDGAGLFDPAGHGIEVTAMSTACWRGFVCRYRVDAGRLLLQDAELGAPATAPPVPLFGVLPGHSAYPKGLRGRWSYSDVDAPVAFTGRLLVGAGIAGIGFLHMGFRPAYGYERVAELRFDGGVRTAAHDRSAELAEVRRRLSEACSRPGPAPGETSGDWIDRTFSLSFEYSWPAD